MLITGLIAVLLLLAIGALPVWPYSRAWGYFGTGGIAIVLLLAILLLQLHVF